MKTSRHAFRWTSLFLLGLPVFAFAHGLGPHTSEDRAYLGLILGPIRDTEARPNGEKPGVPILRILPETAAAAAGFRRGDEVILLNDVFVTSEEKLREELLNESIGSTQRFVLRRDGKQVKVNVTMGGEHETLVTYRKVLARELYGKSLPEPPNAVWWNHLDKSWMKREEPIMPTLEGKVTLFFYFDESEYDVLQKLRNFESLQRHYAEFPQAVPATIVGVFYSERLTREESLAAAEEALAKVDVSYPIAVASYPKDGSVDFNAHQLMNHHGLAILDKKARVFFLHIVGRPSSELAHVFHRAFVFNPPEDGDYNVLKRGAIDPSGTSPAKGN